MQKQQVVEKKHIVKQHAIQLLRSICNYLQDRDTSVFIEWMRFLDVAHEFPTYVATLNEAPMNIFKYKRFELCKKSCPVAVFQWQLPRQLKMKSLWPLWGHGKWKISRVWLPKWSANYFPWIFLSWWPQSHGEKDDEFKLIFFSPAAKIGWNIWNHLLQLYILVVNPLIKTLQNCHWKYLGDSCHVILRSSISVVV